MTVTEKLVADHPLDMSKLVGVVRRSWDQILETRIAGRLHMGTDVTFGPQMMGNFLHALLPVELEQLYPGAWRKELTKHDKDLVYLANDYYSVEVKTSSSPGSIFANRSYAQPSLPGTKNKDGYYMAINFQKFDAGRRPEITRVAFGWLDHTDWVPQAKATGQQAYLTPAARTLKFIRL